MRTIRYPGLRQLACGLAIYLAYLAAGTPLLLAARPATDTTSLRPAGSADEVYPARRIRRLSQMYEELQKLLGEYRTAVNTLKDLESGRTEATTAQMRVNQQLQMVLTEERLLRAGVSAVTQDIQKMKAPQYVQQPVSPRLQRLAAQETGLQQQLGTLQGKLTELAQQCPPASQRVAQLSETVRNHLPKKKQEWFWLCDPLGKLGANAHREGIVLFSQQIAQDRNFAPSYLGRGFAYLHTKEYAKALDDFAKAAALDEDLADVTAAARGWAYTVSHRLPEAGAEFRKAATLNATSPFIELALGHAYVEQQRNNYAEDHFRKAVHFGSRFPQTEEALAYFLASRRAGDPICTKEAIQHATKACELTDWDQWVYLDTLAMACAAAGDFQLAGQWGTRALDRAPREYHTELQERLKMYANKGTDPRQSSKTADTITVQDTASRVKAASSETVGDGKLSLIQFRLPMPKFATPADETQYGASIRELLQAGLGAKSGCLDVARPHYEIALRLCDNDPRLFYAWGLVCLKNRKLTEAQQQFKLATDQAEGGCLPTWQGLARTQLLQRNFNLAIGTLSRFGRVLTVSETHALPQAEKEHYANWLGRAVGLLKQNARNSPTLAGSIGTTDSRFSDVFDTSLRTAYDSGKLQAVQWFREMGLDAGDTTQSQQAKQQQAAPIKHAKIREQVQDEVEKNQLSVDKLPETRDIQRLELQRQYNELTSKYSQVQLEANRLAKSISDAEDMAAARKRAGQSSMIPLTEMSNMKRQYKMLLGQMDEIQRQGKLLVQTGNAFSAQDNIQAGTLAQTNAKLAKREKPVKKGESPAQKKTTASPAQASSVANLTASLDALLPLDYDAEVQRIVDSYLAQIVGAAAPNDPGVSPR